MQAQPVPQADDDDHPPPAGAVAIELVGLDAGTTATASVKATVALAALLTQQGHTGEARVRLVDDAAMTRLHREHKGLDSTTDVLTFDLAESDQLDADIVVCLEEARRQADARGIPVQHELLLYIVHGILHCLGENDDTDANAERMHAREDELLTAIGVGPVYSRPEQTP